jgi:hypothetical protein
MRNARTEFLVDTRMLKAGLAVAGAGFLLAAAGTGLAGLALTRAARDWLNRSEVSPSTMAADMMRQARHATMAGAQAWREFPQVSANGVSGRS